MTIFLKMVIINIVEDETNLIEALSRLIEEKSNEAISKKNKFFIGLSGGSLIKYLASGLPRIKTDFSKWILFFCDERIVPESSSDSTFGAYKKELIDKFLLLKEDQFIKVKQDVSADEAAEDYIKQLSIYFPANETPRFNMLLLGLGPDGHTCSLFPNHKLLNETSTYVAAINDSPKPPPSRITLTFPVINNSESCVFAVSGEEKALTVKKVLKDEEVLPAVKVKPINGNVYWIIHKSAAKYLS